LGGTENAGRTMVAIDETTERRHKKVQREGTWWNEGVQPPIAQCKEKNIATREAHKDLEGKRELAR